MKIQNISLPRLLACCVSCLQHGPQHAFKYCTSFFIWSWHITKLYFIITTHKKFHKCAWQQGVNYEPLQQWKQHSMNPTKTNVVNYGSKHEYHALDSICWLLSK
jgi:hypothetical protein